MLSFFEYLQESSLEEGNPLARVHKFEKEGRASAGITAWREGKSKEDNKSAMKSLDKDLRDKGYGFRKTEGKWEGKGEESRYVTAKGKNKRHLKAFRRDMETLGKKYDQDSVVVRAKKKSVLKGTNTTGYPGMGRVDNVGKTHYNRPEAKAQTEFNPTKPVSQRPSFTTVNVKKAKREEQ